MKNFSLTVDGLTIRGELFTSTSKSQNGTGVLFIHGWESKQDRHFMLAETLAKEGCVCLTFDMRGHGVSDGDHTMFSREDFLRDVLATYDFLAKQNGVKRIVVVGASFGGYLAALLTAQKHIAGLVLRVPADYRDVGFSDPLYPQRNEQSHTEWKKLFHTCDETASLRALHAFNGKVLIVESEKDELVPPQTVHSYREAVADNQLLTYKVMENAPHSISHHPELQREFSTIVTDWVKAM